MNKNTPTPTSGPTEGVTMINDDMKTGWNSCRRQVFMLAEHEQELGPYSKDQGEFARGYRYMAKSFAGAFCSFEAEDCDFLRAAALAAPAPKTGNACPGADDPEERCPKHPSECTYWEVDEDHPTCTSLAAPTPEAVAWTWRDKNDCDYIDMDEAHARDLAASLGATVIPLYAAPPAAPEVVKDGPRPALELTNEQKEITLLLIIAAMGGNTYAGDSPYCWLNWFCSDEVHNGHSDTFNRCIEKGWITSGHCTSFDTSTASLTELGRAMLSNAEGK